MISYTCVKFATYITYISDTEKESMARHNLNNAEVLVNPPRLIRLREYRRGFQTPHGHSPMPATLGRNGYLTTDTAQTQ